MNSVITKTDLDSLKYQIENESELKPQYWVKFGYRGNHAPDETKALKDLVRWSIGVGKKHNAHLKPWPGIEINPNIRLHIHAIVCADKSLPSSIFDSWIMKHGDVWIDKYDSSKGAVYYQWFQHQYEEVQIICPRKKSSCRRKRCKYIIHNL